MHTGKIWTTQEIDWQTGTDRLLSAAGLKDGIGDAKTVLIKPNLVEALDPPITTPVTLVEAIIGYLRRELPQVRISVGEGTGSTSYDTFHCFDELGYTEMAGRCGVELIDLNEESLVRHARADCTRWPEMYLPLLLDEVFLLSVPVLKAHSLSGVTLTMKNMMGCAPPSHYQQGGHWGKSSFHRRIHEAVLDLNRYRCADFTLLDATVGMAQAHLWGPECDPPVGRLAASWDPVAIDSYGCSLLGKSYQKIAHIRGGHGQLGRAEPLDIIDV